LRAPLRGIEGFGKILETEYVHKLDEQGIGYLKRIRVASQRMGQLINDLLSLSRITRREMKHEKVDLSAMVHKIASDLQKEQPQRQVEFVIEEGISVNGDANLLQIVVNNLLGNAWKFTEKHSQARIEFGITKNDKGHVYFVRDDGAGFDMTYADKLFGAFQRLHSLSEFEGTGIGLATVQRIIHRHGGHIWAEGAEEKGATFYFTL
jgi:light-regulated signal transduction histidine kinase (bacteriophytochrome)